MEVGCAYVPWSELKPTVDFIQWAEGGLVDEESIPPGYMSIYKLQMRRLVNTDITDTQHMEKIFNEPFNM